MVTTKKAGITRMSAGLMALQQLPHSLGAKSSRAHTQLLYGLHNLYAIKLVYKTVAIWPLTVTHDW